MTKILIKTNQVFITCALLLVSLANRAFAEALPWETPLEKFTDSLTGPVAKYVSLGALVAAGAGLLFGGDMKEYTRKMLMLVIIIAGLAFSSRILTVLFNNHNWT